MRESGIHIDAVDPYLFPANPFVRSNQLYRGLDPARAADVIIRSKKKYEFLKVWPCFRFCYGSSLRPPSRCYLGC
jgi:hypothetical protein